MSDSNWKYNLGKALGAAGHGLMVFGSGGSALSNLSNGPGSTLSHITPWIALSGALINVLGDFFSELFPKPPGLVLLLLCLVWLTITMI